MAFRNMMEGDCGGQNPLMKFGSHFTQDQAFRQERGHAVPSTLADGGRLVDEFLEERFSQNLQTFRMDALVEEMRDIELYSSRAPINQAPNVAELAPRETQALWSEEFLRAEKLGAGALFDPEKPQSISGSPFPPEFDGMYSVPPPLVPSDQFERAVTNPRSAIGEAWNSEFEKQQRPQPPAPIWGLEGFLENRRDELNLQKYGADSQEAESKFQKFWQKDEEKEQDTSADLLVNNVVLEGYGTDDQEGEWDEIGNQEFWTKMQKMWQQLAGPEPSDSDGWQNEFSSFVDPYKTYEFEAENPMEALKEPFEEGLKKLAEQDLPSAVLCFEAAAKAEPDKAIVWQYLGTTQAENEQDPAAIAAFRKCLSLQPDNLIAMMSLATSYTNENYQNQACQMLREWLQSNPKYKDICGPAPALNHVSSLLDEDYHREVRDLFIKAANRIPMGEIDVDIQCGLGVLFNLSNEHSKAVDCFKAALQAAPSDFRMWNRLGATLANGNRSEEAVDAYYNALQLSPGFIRARYNLGITCINLNSHREAVEHLLTALNLQAKGTTSRGEKGTMSDCIWATLRLVVSLLGNHELLPAVEARDLATLNKEYSIK